jgi:hypothetical protein
MPGEPAVPLEPARPGADLGRAERSSCRLALARAGEVMSCPLLAGGDQWPTADAPEYRPGCLAP